jgi:hypothetical protein
MGNDERVWFGEVKEVKRFKSGQVFGLMKSKKIRRLLSSWLRFGTSGEEIMIHCPLTLGQKRMPAKGLEMEHTQTAFSSTDIE